MQDFSGSTRPVNSLVAGLAAIVAYLIATGTVVPAALLLFVIVALITAAGNVINDYYDAEIDAVNRPDRPIPSGTVSREQPSGLPVSSSLRASLLSLFTTPLCIAIAVINALLLVGYAARLKGTPLPGTLRSPTSPPASSSSAEHWPGSPALSISSPSPS